MGCIACLIGWRRLTRPEDTHLLRMRLADADQELRRLRGVVRDQDRVLAGLYAQTGRLARQLALTQTDARTGEVGR